MHCNFHFWVFLFQFVVLGVNSPLLWCVYIICFVIVWYAGSCVITVVKVLHKTRTYSVQKYNVKGAESFVHIL